jgi:hypothetical protein
MRKRNLRNMALSFTVVSAFALGACDSGGPVGIDEDLDHGVERIRLVVNNQVRAEFDGTSWSGELDVIESTSTAAIDVRLIDHDGALVTPPTNVSLAVGITNGTVARWDQDSASRFRGRMHGVAAGTTEAVFRLMRGGETVYSTTAVQVHVNTP